MFEQESGFKRICWREHLSHWLILNVEVPKLLYSS